MPKRETMIVFWTERSLQNTIAIKEYLTLNFSNKEIQHFYSLLSAFENAVCAFPNLYSETNNKTKIRRAVLSKVLSVFYRVSNNTIEVLAVLDNRCDISKWI